MIAGRASRSPSTSSRPVSPAAEASDRAVEYTLSILEPDNPPEKIKRTAAILHDAQADKYDFHKVDKSLRYTIPDEYLLDEVLNKGFDLFFVGNDPDLRSNNTEWWIRRKDEQPDRPAGEQPRAATTPPATTQPISAPIARAQPAVGQHPHTTLDGVQTFTVVNVLERATGYDHCWWHAKVQQLIAEHTTEPDETGHGHTDLRWLAKLHEQVCTLALKPEAKPYDGNMRVAAAMTLILGHWYSSTQLAKTLDPNRPVDVRQRAHTRYSAWLHNVHDLIEHPYGQLAALFPGQKFDHPFHPEAANGDFT